MATGYQFISVLYLLSLIWKLDYSQGPNIARRSSCIMYFDIMCQQSWVNILSIKTNNCLENFNSRVSKCFSPINYFKLFQYSLPCYLQKKTNAMFQYFNIP